METKKTIRQGIISDENLGEFIRLLVMGPVDIHKAQNEFINKKFEVSQVNDVALFGEEIARIESDTMLRVVAELNDNDKPKFTNVAQRDAETKRRCAEDTAYQGWSAELRAAILKKAELDMAAELLEATAKFHRNLFAANKAVIELAGDLCGEDVNQVRLTALARIKESIEKFEKGE